MKKISKDTPTTQKAINVFPNLLPILNTIAPKLGLSVGSDIGPTNEIYIGKSDNPNVVGFTMSDSKKIYLESSNFGAKIKGLNANSKDVLDFFTPIQDNLNILSKVKKIEGKSKALIYIIDILSILVHERAHNKMNSDEGHLDNEADAVKKEREEAKVMARKGLEHLRKLIDHHKLSDNKDVQKYFDNVDSRYQAGMGQYRTISAGIKKRNILKISKLSNNINDKRYSKLLFDLALKYDKKI